MNSDKGYILLYRSLQEHWLWPEKEYSDLEAWLWLLMNVSHTEHRKRVNGKLLTENRGQLYTSERKLAEKWGWSRRRANGFLKTLEKDDMIFTINWSTKRASLKINNYEHYQDYFRKNGPQVLPQSEPQMLPDMLPQALPDPSLKTSQGEPKEPPINNGKRMEKKEYISNKKNSLVPEGWQPSKKLLESLLEKYPNVTATAIAIEAERFADFSQAKGREYVSFDAGFRNWMRSPYRKPTETLSKSSATSLEDMPEFRGAI